MADMPANQSTTRNPAPKAAEPNSAGRFRSFRGLAAWTSATRRRTWLVALACAALLSGVAAGSFLLGSPGPDAADRLQAALEALDQSDYAEARRLAETLRNSRRLGVEQWGGPVFVLGAVAAREAETAWSRERRGYYLLAARYLEEARDRGFPPGRRAEGLYLLGRSLYLSGQAAASRPPLLESLNADSRRATEIHRLLADAYLNDARPRYEEALEHNTQYLDAPRLTPEDRRAGLLQRARILLELDRPADCLAALDEIPAGVAVRAEVTVMRARVLMHQATKISRQTEVSAEDQLRAQQNYREAINTLRAAQDQDTLSAQATGTAMYLIGLCYLELGDFQAALGQFTRTAELHADGPEKLAATLEQAELSRQLGRDEDALAAYLRVLAEVGDVEQHRNPWVPQQELRDRLLAACRHYLQTQNFPILLPLVRRLEPLLGRPRTLALRAEAYGAHGRDCLRRAHLEPAEAEALRRRGRAEFRRAGWALLELAKEQVATRDYPDHLWNAADAYLAGHDYPQAIAVLKQYLRDETRRRRAEALVRLGQALLAAGRLDEAAAALAECTEFHPRDPATFEARRLAAQVHVEQGRPEQAIELLETNLRGDRLTPASREWRDSLFALGELLHLQGRYDQAIRRLEEAVARYADDPRALEASYLVAEAERRAAERLGQVLQQSAPGAGDAGLSEEAVDRYERALTEYAGVRQALERRQETEELSPQDAALLRNGYFAAGSILFRLGRFEAAIHEYATAVNRYQNAPEVLEAYVQIARAYRRLDSPGEARSALEQAKVVLTRLEPTAAFAATTNYTPQQWAERLARLSEM